MLSLQNLRLKGRIGGVKRGPKRRRIVDRAAPKRGSAPWVVGGVVVAALLLVGALLLLGGPGPRSGGGAVTIEGDRLTEAEARWVKQRALEILNAQTNPTAKHYGPGAITPERREELARQAIKQARAELLRDKALGRGPR